MARRHKSSGRKKLEQEHRDRRAALIREIPIGETFLVEWDETGTGRKAALYRRVNMLQIGCVVNTVGQTHDITKGRLQEIASTGFQIYAKIIALDADDQAVREMQAIHGAGKAATGPKRQASLT